MKHRTVRVSALLVFVVGLAVVGCSPKEFGEQCPTAACPNQGDGATGSDASGGSKCEGCTQGAEGRCVEGTADDNCGSGGETCKTCEGDRVCSDSGECVEPSCNSDNCKGCCRAGACRLGTKDFACGSGGESCTNCKQTAQCTPRGECLECRGCWDADGYCRRGVSEDFCGTGGVECETCAMDETCKAGSCTKIEQTPCSESCVGCCRDGNCAQGSDTSACGRGGEICKTCAEGFDCDTGSCVLAPDSQWEVIAIETTLIQSTIDVDSASGPDPRLEATVGEISGQTETFTDTYLAQWNEVVLTASASAIRNNFSYKIMDKDRISDDDRIVDECVPSFTQRAFKQSEVQHTCIGGENSGARATTRFRLAPK